MHSENDLPNAHGLLYSKIADWYVHTYYDDLSDLDWLQLFMASTPAQTLVADVGCGPGQYARLFRDNGFSVISVDVAENMLIRGVQLDPQLLPLVADIRQLPFRNGCLGSVFAGYTLEHVCASEIEMVLEEVYRALEPSGSFGLSVKCGEGSYEFRSQHGDKGFVQLWSLDELSEQLASVGFSVVTTDTKAAVSPEEFDHDRGFVLATKARSSTQISSFSNSARSSISAS